MASQLNLLQQAMITPESRYIKLAEKVLGQFGIKYEISQNHIRFSSSTGKHNFFLHVVMKGKTPLLILRWTLSTPNGSPGQWTDVAELLTITNWGLGDLMGFLKLDPRDGMLSLQS